MTRAEVTEPVIMPQVATPCMGRLGRREWDRTLAVRTGSWVVGIRTNSPDTRALVDALLQPLRAPELDQEVSPNLSVELFDETTTRGRLQIIYRDSEVVGRRRARRDAVLDLLLLLDEGPRVELTERLVIHASGIADEAGRAVLLPGRMHVDLLVRRAQLEAAGLLVLPTRTAVVDPESAQLFGELRDPVLAELAEGLGFRPTRHTVAAWCFLTPATPSPKELGPATGVFRGCGDVVNRRSAGMGETMRRVRTLAARTRLFGLPKQSSRATASTVIDLPRSERVVA